MGRALGSKQQPRRTKGGGDSSGLRVAELFAGVGGFHLGFAKAGHRTVWANQWEPSAKVQHAADVYRHRFPDTELSNEDITTVLDRLQGAPGDGDDVVPSFDLLCGGFPCQDYSVAKPLHQARGIQGKKGVLWWQIHRLVEHRLPRFIVLENVDRLLKSPSTHRGRDFAIILACLNDLDYIVEWRVINAAEYGFPQRRRRVFLLAYRAADAPCEASDAIRDGYFAKAFPVRAPRQGALAMAAPPFEIKGELHELSSPTAVLPPMLGNAGVSAPGRKVWTGRTEPSFRGRKRTLGALLQPHHEVPEEFFISPEQVERWLYLKGAKSEERTTRDGFCYRYSEGGMRFPDPLDEPARTILTGEGGSSPSRFKHVVKVETPAGSRLRRLTPIELERLNGFPDDHTAFGSNGPLPATKRAFLMGNALVVGIPGRLGRVLPER